MRLRGRRYLVRGIVADWRSVAHDLQPLGFICWSTGEFKLGSSQSRSRDSRRELSVTLSILLVEDDAGAVGPMADALAYAGHNVSIATDGGQAMQLLVQSRFDIMIAEVETPKVDGLTLASWAQENTSDVSVVLMSASIPREVVSAKGGPAVHFLQRPFGLAELLATVHHAGQSARVRGTSMPRLASDGRQPATTRRGTLAEARDGFERAYILRTLEAVGWSGIRAAALLGLSYEGLRDKLRRHGLDAPLPRKATRPKSPAPTSANGTRPSSAGRRA